MKLLTSSQSCPSTQATASAVGTSRNHEVSLERSWLLLWRLRPGVASLTKRPNKYEVNRTSILNRPTTASASWCEFGSRFPWLLHSSSTWKHSFTGRPNMCTVSESRTVDESASMPRAYIYITRINLKLGCGNIASVLMVIDCEAYKILSWLYHYTVLQTYPKSSRK
jgi:hypothetical protein